MLEDKITAAEKVIDAVLRNYRNPCLLCSFGKDSMVLLYMLRQWHKPLPVVFFRQPFFQRKYAYANRIIEDWNLQEIYQDVPPFGVAVSHGQGKTEFVNHYNFGGKTIMVPIGWLQPKESEPYLCGKEDIYNRPLGTFNWPWDCAIVGHKATDTDPLHPSLNIEMELVQNPNACDCAFPLREWSDEDIWAFTEKYDVPINHGRYEKSDEGWRVKEGQYYDSDYFPYCNKCFDPSQPDVVDCPKLGVKVENMKNKLQYQNPLEEVGYIK